MNRRLLFLACIILLSLVPYAIQIRSATQGTVPGQIRLYMFREDTGGLNTGVNTIYATIGDTITVDLFLRNNQLIPVSALEIYLTMNNDYFDVVPQGINEDKLYYYRHPKPFIQGEFLRRAFGSIPPWGNNTHNDTLTANDNGLDGWQLDYVEITPQDLGDGNGRPSSRDKYGLAARLMLVCKAPCDSAFFTLDRDQYNQRVSSYHQPNANDNFYFQSFFTCYITVTGVAINPPLPDILMEPGSIDTTLSLNDHLGLTSVDESAVTWTASGNSQVGVSINPSTHRVTFTAPAGFRGYEDVAFTVSSGGSALATDSLRVTVDYRPRLNAAALRDTIRIHEDSLEAVLRLRDIVTDTDDTFEQLTWSFSAPNINASVVGDSLFLKGTQDYFGFQLMTMRVFDSLSLGDSLNVPVEVLPVNDPPVISGLPDVSIERGEDYQFDLGTYAHDVDNDPLVLSWDDTENLNVSVDGTTVSISGDPAFVGQEQLVLTVTDPLGLAASDSMLVTLIQARKPPVWTKIPKVGFAQGEADSSLVLWNYVEDPDDPDELLTFEITNDDDVDLWYVEEGTGRLFLYDLDNRVGWDRLTVTASDPDGNLASTQFLVFIAPADGTPIVGGIPDTTLVAGTQANWIDLDEYYYDIDNTDNQMTWSWSREAAADSSVTVSINRVSHFVRLTTLGYDKYGVNKIIFTVTDPDSKFADDITLITVVEELNKPVLDLPPKVGFVAGDEVELDLDDYVYDPEYLNAELNWSWSGNHNADIVFSTPTIQNTRPVIFTGAEDWIGWERVGFAVMNPIGGAAYDTLTVFSVGDDGVPVAGGLTGLTIKAGQCVTVSLDDYFYDADSPDFSMTWTVAGNDSITVDIEPLSHTATICAPSETWEGQELLTWTVIDPEGNSATMNTPVLVIGAVLRNVFNVLVFRNPMQEDYMDMFVESSHPISGIPSLKVYAQADSTAVTLGEESDDYFHGRYLLPLDLSLGQQNMADMIARGTTATGKAVQDTSRFVYGRFGVTGGKLAIDALELALPHGALAKSVLLTVVPEGRFDAGAEKSTDSEVETADIAYVLGPRSLSLAEPATVTFMVTPGIHGAGIYRETLDGLEYLGATAIPGGVCALLSSPGTVILGFDHQAPRVGKTEIANGEMVISLEEYGSGIDAASLSVAETSGATLDWRWDMARNAVVIDAGNRPPQTLSIMFSVSDRAGNNMTETMEINTAGKPGLVFVEQNSPNPFNPVTTIRFTTTSSQRVRIDVYDLLGRRVKTIVDDRFSAGIHEVVWDATDDDGRTVASAMYMYRVTNGVSSVTRKMLFLR